MILNDIWYVLILRRHKHEYIKIGDGCDKIEKNGKMQDVRYQRHRCIRCNKIVKLDIWQIATLPANKLYEQI